MGLINWNKDLTNSDTNINVEKMKKIVNSITKYTADLNRISNKNY
jgi:hypothetical protein